MYPGSYFSHESKKGACSTIKAFLQDMLSGIKGLSTLHASCRTGKPFYVSTYSDASQNSFNLRLLETLLYIEHVAEDSFLYLTCAPQAEVVSQNRIKSAISPVKCVSPFVREFFSFNLRLENIG